MGRGRVIIKRKKKKDSDLDKPIQWRELKPGEPIPGVDIPVEKEPKKKPEKKQLPLQKEHKLEVDEIFSMSARERIERCSDPDYKRPMHTKESVIITINDFEQMNPAQLQYASNYYGVEMTMMERMWLGAVSDASGTGKRKYTAMAMIHDRQFGQAKQTQEITGADGKPLISTEKKRVQEILKNMSPEERQAFKNKVQKLVKKSLPPKEEK